MGSSKHPTSRIRHITNYKNFAKVKSWKPGHLRSLSDHARSQVLGSITNAGKPKPVRPPLPQFRFVTPAREQSESCSKQRTKARHHAAIGVNILRTTGYVRLRRERHQFKRVVDFLTDFLRQPMTPKQWKAFQAWQDFARDWIVEKGGGQPSKKRMRSLIRIFNELFFAGTLGNIGFTWQPLSDLGDCSGRAKGSRYWSKIRMDPSKDHNKGFMPNSYETGLVNTLLHECIHAYLWMYACGENCQDPECQSELRTQHGNNGHGIAFCRIASWIQALGRMYLMVSVDVDFLLDITQHYITSGTLPDETELSGYHEWHHDTLRRLLAHARTDGNLDTGSGDSTARARRVWYFKQEERQFNTALTNTYSCLDVLKQAGEQHQPSAVLRSV